MTVARYVLVAALLPVCLAAAPQVREGPKEPVGSARLTGTVVGADETHAPIRRAIVTLAGAGLGLARSVVTDDAGRFVFDHVPAGAFTVTASKAAYLSSAYGAKRPDRPGTPVVVAAGQSVADIVLPLSRGGVIAGTVHNADNSPIAGLQILALRNGAPPPRIFGPGLGSPDATFTDDRGEYRIFGLAPGSYAVVAVTTSTQLNELHQRTTSELDAEFREAQARGQAPTTPPVPPPIYAVAPIYYPGTPVAADAVRVEVTVGSVHEDVSFTAEPVPSAAVEGVVTRPAEAAGRLTLLISGADTAQPLTMTTGPRLVMAPGPDGKFRYVNVSPGHYTLTAIADPTPALPPGTRPPPPTASAAIWWATADIAVNGTDIPGVSLSLQPGMTVTGRVAFDAPADAVPKDLTILRVILNTTSTLGTSMVNGTVYGTVQRSAFARVDPDGTFTITGVAPGPYRVSVTTPGVNVLSTFWIRSAIVESRDVLDTLLTIAPNQIVDRMVVTLTNRHTELNGALETPEGHPAPEYFVVAVPTDRSLWIPDGRRIRSTRPATDGHYAFADLPPGSYLVSAVDDLDPADLSDPAFLQSIAAAGVTVTIGEGEIKRQDLRLR